jgi:hypothetical protein
MSTGNGQSGYAVSYPPPVLDQLQQWAVLAAAAGLTGEYAAFLLELRDRLKYGPAGWADSGWSVGEPATTVYCRYTRLVTVFYAVAEDLRAVVVQRVVLTPGSPLAELR